MKKIILAMMVAAALALFASMAMAEQCETSLIQSKKDKGREYYNSKDYARAFACFSESLNKEGADSETYYLSGLTQLVGYNNPQAASSEFAKAGSYKAEGAKKMHEMAKASANPGWAYALFTEYVRLTPGANRTEIAEFFFHLAVDKNMNLVVDEETKEQCFRFAESFDAKTAGKLEASYRDKWLAEGKGDVHKDIAAGNYSSAVSRMKELRAKGATAKELEWEGRKCLSNLMGEPEKGIHGDAYRADEKGEAIAKDERACAEIVLGKEHVDMVAPERIYFSTNGSVEFFVNGKSVVTDVLPWGVKVYSCDGNECIYNFSSISPFNPMTKVPFEIGRTIGEYLSLSNVTFGNTPNDKMFCRLYSEYVNGKNRYCTWIPKDADDLRASGGQRSDIMYQLVVDKEASAPIWLGLSVEKPSQ